MATRLAKPEMRHLYAKSIKFHLVGAALTSIASGLAWKLLYMDPKKRRYEEFYKTYDPEAKEKIMIEAGLLQSMERIKS